MAAAASFSGEIAYLLDTNPEKAIEKVLGLLSQDIPLNGQANTLLDLLNNYHESDKAKKDSWLEKLKNDDVVAMMHIAELLSKKHLDGYFNRTPETLQRGKELIKKIEKNEKYLVLYNKLLSHLLLERLLDPLTTRSTKDEICIYFAKKLMGLLESKSDKSIKKIDELFLQLGSFANQVGGYFSDDLLEDLKANKAGNILKFLSQSSSREQVKLVLEKLKAYRIHAITEYAHDENPTTATGALEIESDILRLRRDVLGKMSYAIKDRFSRGHTYGVLFKETDDIDTVTLMQIVELLSEGHLNGYFSGNSEIIARDEELTKKITTNNQSDLYYKLLSYELFERFIDINTQAECRFRMYGAIPDWQARMSGLVIEAIRNGGLTQTNAIQLMFLLKDDPENLDLNLWFFGLWFKTVTERHEMDNQLIARLFSNFADREWFRKYFTQLQDRTILGEFTFERILKIFEAVKGVSNQEIATPLAAAPLPSSTKAGAQPAPAAFAFTGPAVAEIPGHDFSLIGMINESFGAEDAEKDKKAGLFLLAIELLSKDIVRTKFFEAKPSKQDLEKALENLYGLVNLDGGIRAEINRLKIEETDGEKKLKSLYAETLQKYAEELLKGDDFGSPHREDHLSAILKELKIKKFLKDDPQNPRKWWNSQEKTSFFGNQFIQALFSERDSLKIRNFFDGAMTAILRDVDNRELNESQLNDSPDRLSRHPAVHDSMSDASGLTSTAATKKSGGVTSHQKRFDAEEIAILRHLINCAECYSLQDNDSFAINLKLALALNLLFPSLEELRISSGHGSSNALGVLAAGVPATELSGLGSLPDANAEPLSPVAKVPDAASRGSLMDSEKPAPSAPLPAVASTNDLPAQAVSAPAEILQNSVQESEFIKEIAKLNLPVKTIATLFAHGIKHGADVEKLQDLFCYVMERTEIKLNDFSEGLSECFKDPKPPKENYLIELMKQIYRKDGAALTTSRVNTPLARLIGLFNAKTRSLIEGSKLESERSKIKSLGFDLVRYILADKDIANVYWNGELVENIIALGKYFGFKTMSYTGYGDKGAASAESASVAIKGFSQGAYFYWSVLKVARLSVAEKNMLPSQYEQLVKKIEDAINEESKTVRKQILTLDRVTRHEDRAGNAALEQLRSSLKSINEIAGIALREIFGSNGDESKDAGSTTNLDMMLLAGFPYAKEVEKQNRTIEFWQLCAFDLLQAFKVFEPNSDIRKIEFKDDNYIGNDNVKKGVISTGALLSGIKFFIDNLDNCVSCINASQDQMVLKNLKNVAEEVCRINDRRLYKAFENLVTELKSGKYAGQIDGNDLENFYKEKLEQRSSGKGSPAFAVSPRISTSSDDARGTPVVATAPPMPRQLVEVRVPASGSEFFAGSKAGAAAPAGKPVPVTAKAAASAAAAPAASPSPVGKPASGRATPAATALQQSPAGKRADGLSGKTAALLAEMGWGKNAAKPAYPAGKSGKGAAVAKPK